MATTEASTAGRDRLRRRAVRLEYCTVGWNVVEAVVALAIAAFMVHEGIEILRGENGPRAG